MSLIAAFKASSVPILFGDLLISGPEIVGKPFSIPGVGSIHQIFPEGSGFTPVGFLHTDITDGVKEAYIRRNS